MTSLLRILIPISLVGVILYLITRNDVGTEPVALEIKALQLAALVHENENNSFSDIDADSIKCEVVSENWMTATTQCTAKTTQGDMVYFNFDTQLFDKEKVADAKVGAYG